MMIKLLYKMLWSLMTINGLVSHDNAFANAKHIRWHSLTMAIHVLLVRGDNQKNTNCLVLRIAMIKLLPESGTFEM